MLPMIEECLIPHLKYAQLIEAESPFGPSDPPSGYVFNSLGTISGSAVSQTALVLPYTVQYIDYAPIHEVQLSWYSKSLIPSEKSS